MQQTSTIQPRKGHQSDKYQGGIHTITKLRHGRGSYTYDNPFFAFEGNYLNGKKNGPGRLTHKDGRTISANFFDDEMIGPAEITYPDGAKYVGTLSMGEKEGTGTFDSAYESYRGEWKDNCKHGLGTYENHSTGEKYEGEFKTNKPHGKGKLTRWNYFYQGEFEDGRRQGSGVEASDWLKDQQNPLGKYEYEGQFKADKFHGHGVFKSRESTYSYKGDFAAGQPTLYPNQFRLFLSTNTKNGEETTEGEKSILLSQAIEYELEGDSFNLYIETVYQGPEVLDEIQPTQEEIDAMVKAWQAENKKNKNPPPMPDFTQPRMKKPQMVVVQQENGRPLELRLIREADGKEESLKIDYRAEIQAKRKENEQLRLQAARKAEEEGTKKGGKKDSKGEAELKVNLFKEHPHPRQRVLKVATESGRCHVHKLQFPDDFPAGKYSIEVRSAFSDFGEVRVAKKDLVIKAKQLKKK